MVDLIKSEPFRFKERTYVIKAVIDGRRCRIFVEQNGRKVTRGFAISIEVVTDWWKFVVAYLTEEIKSDLVRISG